MANLAIIRIRDQRDLQWHLNTAMKQTTAPAIGSYLAKFEATQGKPVIPLNILAQWAAVFDIYKTKYNKTHTLEIIDDIEQYCCPFLYDTIILLCDAQNFSASFRMAKNALEQNISVAIACQNHSIFKDNAAESLDISWIDLSNEAFYQWLSDYDNNRLKQHYIFKYIPEITNHNIIPKWKEDNKPSYAPLIVPIKTWKRRNDGALTRRPISDIIEEIIALKREEIISFDKYIIFDNPITTNDNNFILTLAQNLAYLELRWVAPVNPNELSQQDCETLKKSGCIATFAGSQLSFESFMRFLPVVKINPKNTSLLKKNAILTVAFYTLPPCLNNLSKLQQLVKKNNADINHFYIYTPEPGTDEFYELDAKYKIRTYDWNKYDNKHVVLHTKNHYDKNIEIIRNILVKQNYSTWAKFKAFIMPGIIKLKTHKSSWKERWAIKLALNCSIQASITPKTQQKQKQLTNSTFALIGTYTHNPS